MYFQTMRPHDGGKDHIRVKRESPTNNYLEWSTFAPKLRMILPSPSSN